MSSASDETTQLVTPAGTGSNNSNTNSGGFTGKYTEWVDSGDVTMVAAISMLLYVVLAVIGYSLIFEDWPIIDSVYFAITVFTTIGKPRLSFFFFVKHVFHGTLTNF